MTGRARRLPERARFALAAAVLLAGGLLYLVRPTDPAAVRWLEQAHLGFLADAVRATRAFVYARAPLPGWLRGSASDFAYAFAIGIVFGNGSRRMVALGVAVALAHEMAQGLGVVGGTFDVVDLGVLTAAYALAILLFRPRDRAATRAPQGSTVR
jgi:hypothetical protein